MPVKGGTEKRKKEEKGTGREKIKRNRTAPVAWAMVQTAGANRCRAGGDVARVQSG
jgi:hypothetical protein